MDGYKYEIGTPVIVGYIGLIQLKGTIVKTLDPLYYQCFYKLGSPQKTYSIIISEENIVLDMQAYREFILKKILDE